MKALQPFITSIEDAIKAYVADEKGRNLSKETTKQSKMLFEKQLLPWAEHRGLIRVRDLTVSELVIFRSTWGNNGLTTNRKLTRLAGFFSFCIQNGWLTDNPALKIKRATVSSIPTGWFPKPEFQRIVDATYTYGEWQGGHDFDARAGRLRALVLLDAMVRLATSRTRLRWSATASARMTSSFSTWPRPAFRLRAAPRPLCPFLPTWFACVNGCAWAPLGTDEQNKTRIGDCKLSRSSLANGYAWTQSFMVGAGVIVAMGLFLAICSPAGYSAWLITRINDVVLFAPRYFMEAGAVLVHLAGGDHSFSISAPAPGKRVPGGLDR